MTLEQLEVDPTSSIRKPDPPPSPAPTPKTDTHPCGTFWMSGPTGNKLMTWTEDGRIVEADTDGYSYGYD